MKIVTLVLFALLIAASVRGGADAPARKPAILYIGSWGAGLGNNIAIRFHDAGFEIATASPPDSGLTWNDVKGFNVLVIGELGNADGEGKLSAGNRVTIDTLNKFLQAGGGIIYCPDVGQIHLSAFPQQQWAGTLGLTPLFDTMLADPVGTVNATAWALDYSRAATITASPITAGVSALWYPHPADRVGGQTHSVPLAFDTTWTPLVQTSASTVSRNVPYSVGQYSRGDASSDKTGPVTLAACRSVGPGRVFVVGISRDYLFGPYAITTLEDIVLKHGLGGQPSDGQKLLVNAARWAAKPSAASMVIGGATTPARMLTDPYKTVFVKPYDWSNARVADAPQQLPGVIGARTAYSTGHGTVDDWAAKAKASGLAYVVFLEEFASLSRESFDKLKADCARVTAPDFAAIPGFTIDDVVGFHYYYFGTTFNYPAAVSLTADGRRFRSADGAFDYQKPGQLAMTTLDYAYTYNGFKLTSGNYGFADSHVPFANFFSNFDSLAVVSTKNGKPIEDLTAGYRDLLAVGQAPTPLAVTFMDDPSQIDREAWRTVLCLRAGDSRIEGGILHGPSRVADYWNIWHFYPDSPSSAYVTNGPIIDRWAYIGPRDYEGGNPGDFVWQNYRWRLQGNVHSAAGLKSITVYDGTRVFRRYDAGGQKTFSFSIDMTHDRQHDLSLEVVDSKGGRAISGEQFDRNHRAEEFNCSDRNNQLYYGYVTNKDGYGILVGGNQEQSTPNKRVSGREVSPAGSFRNGALLGAPAFDGSANGDPTYFSLCEIHGATPVTAPSVVNASRVMQNGDVHIGDGVWGDQFTETVPVYNVWHTLWSTEPAKDYTIQERHSFFEPDINSPLAVLVWRTRITLKRDVPNTGVALGILTNGKSKAWAAKGADGASYGGAWTDAAKGPATKAIDLGIGGYVAQLGSPLGSAAAFPLTDSLRTSVNPHSPSRFNLEIPAAKSPQRAGEAVDATVLLLGIPRPTEFSHNVGDNPAATIDRFASDFGLRDGRPAYTVKATAGTIRDRRYVLSVNGLAGAFSGSIHGDLISSLPIEVFGVNPNVSCYLYDRAIGKARPIGQAEGVAYATLAVHGDVDVFIGQPVTASNPALTVQLTQTGDTAWSVEVHNPTSKAIKASMSVNRLFDPLRGMRLDDVTVAAGASVTVGL